MKKIKKKSIGGAVVTKLNKKIKKKTGGDTCNQKDNKEDWWRHL